MNENITTILKTVGGWLLRPTLRPLARMAGYGGASLLLVATAMAANTNTVNHVNPAEAKKLIAEKKVVVLDVRTPKEFAAGHIAGATNINFLSADFAKAIAGLNPNQTYLLHCAVGGRSTQSLPKFEQLQFQSLYHLDGGLKAWEKAGLPVQK